MVQDWVAAGMPDIERYRERLQLLREIDRAVLKAQSVDQTAAAAVESFRRSVPCLRASVALFDLAADEVTLLATSSDSELQLRAGARTQLSRAFLFGDSPQGRPNFVADVRVAPSDHPWVELLRREGVRGYASLPLDIEDQVIGALTFGLADPGPPSSEALEIATDVADQLAIAIAIARLQDQNRRHAEELEARVAARTAALRLSEARLRAIFEAAPVGILLATNDGRLLQANPALQAMLGYTEAELRELTFTDLLQAGSRHPGAGWRPDAPTGSGALPFKADFVLRRKDGRRLWSHMTVAHVHASPEAGELTVAMVEDITEARRAQTALIRAEKLAITGRIGASLAHEINNPLQSIIGCLELADETLAEPETAGRYLDVAREELRRVARTVVQLRELQVDSEPGPVEAVALNDMLAQLLTLNELRCAQQGVEVVWRPANRLPTLVVAADRIRQVFLNIILNALDAMPQGGTLTIHTMRTREPAGVRVTIRDTGEGIAPEVLARIFEPFYSAKKKGLGLGLYTSRNIIERYGGVIDVRSRPRRGSSFEVWLPAGAASPEDMGRQVEAGARPRPAERGGS